MSSLLKGECQIEQFKGKHILTKNAAKLYIDREIKHDCENLDDICEICGVTLKPSKSFTREVKGIKSVDNHSSLLIGRGFIADIHDAKGSLLCNGHCQKSKNNIYYIIKLIKL
jgi:hypothetical protein